MPEILEPSAARRILRHQIWRRDSRYLAVLGIVGLAAAALAVGIPAFERYDDSWVMDGTLRLSLYAIAFAIAFAVVRRESADRPHLLKRLPVDPATAVQARLQIGLLLGVVAFGALALTEYVAEPTLMHPGFANRLNPAEVATLERLPGVPLLRFEIDGEVTRGLASELSFAAIRSRKGALPSYGETFRRPHFRQGAAPMPGEMIARLTREDWSELDGSDRRRLRRIGIPHLAEVRVVLERYVDQHSYLSEPWRRDGLFRERRWHLLDRAAVFFGLIYCLICALSADRSGWVWGILWPLSLLALYQSQFDYIPGRNTVLFSDFGHQQRPQVPTLDAHQTLAENLVWPCLIAVACFLIHFLTTRSLRSQGTAPSTFVDLRRRMNLLALYLAVALCIGSIFGRPIVAFLRHSPSIDSGQSWGSAFVAGLIVAGWLTHRWGRRDVLLSRLPVRPSEVARRRLVTALLGFTLVALLPLLFEQLVSMLQLASSDAESTSHSWRPDRLAFTKSLLIFAIGNVALISALFRSRFAGMLAMVAGIMVPMVAWMFSSTSFILVTFSVHALSLPLTYLLIRRRVALGRAPSLSELLRAA